MGRQRVASLPDVPTIAEQGFPEVDITGWFAMIGPPKMSETDVKRLHDALAAALAMPEAKEAMARQENDINPSTPQEAVRFFRSELDRYARLVKKANITLD
jgi:tripartite-type tricarboxylate transporter receptor subunit TctC